MSHGRTWSEQDYSPLTQVNDKNVQRLGLAWYADLNTYRGVEATPLEVDGKTVPWLHVGALTMAFVTAPSALDAQTIATTRFLRWQGGRFENVSAEVAAGRIAVKP